jgi:hypothetical protein
VTRTAPDDDGFADELYAPLRLIDVATGESKVFVDGDWLDAGRA